MIRPRLAVLLPLCLLACSETNPGEDTPDATASADAGAESDAAPRPALFEPPAGEFAPEPAAFEDLDPDPHVVEVELTAAEATVEYLPGLPTRVYAYNGAVPGPTLRAHAGDTVVVHFHNRLPEATTIHWHGLRVPLAMDGVPVDGGIAPGADFEYRFTVPDAGTFWYHPHARSDEQVERGLYGAIVVAPPEGEAPAWPAGARERVLVVDDVLLEADGALADFDYTDDDAHLGAHAAHMGTVMLGREGNLLLVNGLAHPTLTIDRATPERWRVVNAANARYLGLSLPGFHVRRIGASGGLLPAAEEVPADGLVLVPGERADLWVEATPDTPDSVQWRSLSYNRGHGTGTRPDVVLAEIRATGAAPTMATALPEPLAEVPVLPEPAGAPVRVALGETVAVPGDGHDAHAGGTTTDPMATMEPVFTINDEVFPDVTPLTARVGASTEWDVVNTSEMDHPFHLHGFFFQVVPNADGEQARPGWHDTVNIPRDTTVRLRWRPDDRAGTWMFHCHILEHAERGMIGLVEVGPAD